MFWVVHKKAYPNFTVPIDALASTFIIRGCTITNQAEEVIFIHIIIAWVFRYCAMISFQLVYSSCVVFAKQCSTIEYMY